MGLYKKHANSSDKIKYIKTEKNDGKGNAIKEAINFLNSTQFHDADLEYFPKETG